jgi:hypothetical protein
MQTQIDHPLVRAGATCPLCGDRKDRGLVCCWSCYKLHGVRYGNQAAEAKIDAAEVRLAARDARMRGALGLAPTGGDEIEGRCTGGGDHDWASASPHCARCGAEGDG